MQQQIIKHMKLVLITIGSQMIQMREIVILYNRIFIINYSSSVSLFPPEKTSKYEQYTRIPPCKTYHCAALRSLLFTHKDHITYIIIQ